MNNGDSGASTTTKDSDQIRAADNFSVMENNPISSNQQTTVFKEEPDMYGLDISAERDSTYNDGFSDNVPLGDFLSRPVKIVENTWTTNFVTSSIDTRFDPWTLWQDDARVKAKLSNFAYASFDLKLRIVINGTPFQYGRLMLIYSPYSQLDIGNVTTSTRNQTATEVQRWHSTSGASGRIEQAFQHFSTYPCVYLDPSRNQVKEMTLPFMWHNNYISLNGDSTQNKESLGTVIVYDMNPLRIANTSAPTKVNYTVYAWAENLKLCVPTEFTPTSSFSKKNDEYADGKVSTVASSVAAAAGELKNVPVIGPFAKATQIGAGAISNVARLFGFSAPAMIENPGRCELKMHGRLANTMGEDASYSLAMDPKQEITVDPRTVGVKPYDEMTIKSIACREQFLARCEWKSDVGQFTTEGAERLIFASLVSPNQIHRSGTGSVSSGPDRQAVMDHPAGWLANMFQYWKGSITYRVEVVCTPMHSGRLKLQFDPFIKAGGHVVSDVNTEDVNARYTMILDLKEASETEFTIDWNNRRPWLRTLSSEAKSTFQPYRTDIADFTLQTLYDEEVHMGMFTVSVVNELVAPIETNGAASATKAPVQVNIFFKVNDDFRLAQPSEDASGWSTYTMSPTSTFIATSSFETPDDNGAVTEHRTLDSEIDMNNTNVFFGEDIVSIRTLIKRYVNVFTGDYSNESITDIDEIVTRMLPFTPAYPQSSKSRRHSYLSYLMPGFIVSRGSSRYKLTFYVKGHDPPAGTSPTYYSWVERTGFRSPTDTIGYPVVNSGSASSATLDATILHGYNGACFTESTYQPTLEFQMPFYSNTRYMLGCYYQNVAVTGNEQLQLNPSMTQILAARNVYTGRNAHANVMQQWHAAGDDFSLHFFTGVPMYFFA